MILTGGNRNDVTQLLRPIDAIPPSAGFGAGRNEGLARCSPIVAMTTTSTAGCYGNVRITPKIARRGEAHGSGLGRQRWVVERTFARLHYFRRLRTRYERRADIHQTIISIACSVICLRRLLNSF